MHVCMYVCMYACMYACKHVCIYAFMHVCMYACMHACMYVCMHAYMHACMYACMYVCMYASMHVCMYACMHVGRSGFDFALICSFEIHEIPMKSPLNSRPHPPQPGPPTQTSVHCCRARCRALRSPVTPKFGSCAMKGQLDVSNKYEDAIAILSLFFFSLSLSLFIYANATHTSLQSMCLIVLYCICK